MTDAVITDQYGFSEGAGNASKCEYGNYHLDHEYGILLPGYEINNTRAAQANNIFGTSFYNEYIPLINYETGDTAVWGNEMCKCGRNSRIIKKIVGRKEDFVETPEGNRISRFDYIYKGIETIAGGQIIQHSLNNVEVILRGNNIKDSDLKDLNITIDTILVTKQKISISKHGKFILSNNNKFKPVISYIKYD